MEFDHSSQPGLEPVRHPDQSSVPKPENSAFTTYGGPPVSNSRQHPYQTLAHSQNSYQSPQHSYGSPAAGFASTAGGDQFQQPNETSKRSGRICGLVGTTFFLLLASVILIIAAAVGGGVGSSMAVKNAKSACLSDAAVTVSSLSAALASATSSGKTSPTSTGASSTSSSSSSAAATSASSTQPWGPVGTAIGETFCPIKDGSIYTATINNIDKYAMYCNKDQPGNDLMQTLVTTMGLCMEACSSWNLAPVSVKCAGIAYVPSFIDGNPNHMPIDCYLKSVGNVTALAANSYVVDFAILQ